MEFDEAISVSLETKRIDVSQFPGGGTMKIDEQREAIRASYVEALYREMEPLRPSHARRWAEDMAVELLGKATEKGAVLRSHWADCKAPPSGKAFMAVIDGIGYIADCGCPNTVLLMEKK